MSQDHRVIQKNEMVSDIVIQLKDPVCITMLNIWESVYKNTAIPRTKWLAQFQLSLKQIKDYTDEDILLKLSNKKHLLQKLYNVFLLTAIVYHDGMHINIAQDKVLLVTFTKNCLLQVARELWSKPYIVYNITHKKEEVASAKAQLENIIVDTIKFEIRRTVDDIVVIENERIESARCLVSPSVDIVQKDENLYNHISNQLSDDIVTDVVNENELARSPSASSCSSMSEMHDLKSVKSIDITRQEVNQTPLSMHDTTEMDVLDYIPTVDEPSSSRPSSPLCTKEDDVLKSIDLQTDVITPSKRNGRHHRKKNVTALDKYSNYRNHNILEKSSRQRFF